MYSLRLVIVQGNIWQGLLTNTTQNCCLLIALALFFSRIQLRTATFWSYLLCYPRRYNSELLSSDPTCSLLLSNTTQNCYRLILLPLFSSQAQLRTTIFWSCFLCSFSSQIQLRTAIFWSYLLCSLRYKSELLPSDPTCSLLLSNTTQNCYLLILLGTSSS
jgi:hypothetical protein